MNFSVPLDAYGVFSSALVLLLSSNITFSTIGYLWKYRHYTHKCLCQKEIFPHMYRSKLLNTSLTNHPCLRKTISHHWPKELLHRAETMERGDYLMNESPVGWNGGEVQRTPVFIPTPDVLEPKSVAGVINLRYSEGASRNWLWQLLLTVEFNTKKRSTESSGSQK